MDLHKFFFKLNKKHSAGDIDHLDKRRQWDCLENRARKIFQDVIDQAQKSEFWQHLYIDSDLQEVWNGLKYKNYSHIALCMGKRPMIIHAEEYRNGMKIGYKGFSETGGAFLISQVPNGGVVFSLYASKSDFHRPEIDPIIINKFDQPFNVTDEMIYRAVKHMLVYAQDTSYTGYYPRWKHMLYLFKKNRSGILLGTFFAFLSAIIGFILALLIMPSC